MPAGKSPWEAVYSPRQRIAMALAYQPGECSSSRVCELAAEGKLLDQNGRRVPPFDAKPGSVRVIAARVKRGQALDGMNPKAAQQMYDRLAARARRLGDKARTAREITEAAAALKAAEQLRGEVDRLPKPSESTLAKQVMEALKDSSVDAVGSPTPGDEEPAVRADLDEPAVGNPTPVPEPVVDPEPEPDDPLAAVVRRLEALRDAADDGAGEPPRSPAAPAVVTPDPHVGWAPLDPKPKRQRRVECDVDYSPGAYHERYGF